MSLYAAFGAQVRLLSRGEPAVRRAPSGEAGSRPRAAETHLQSSRCGAEGPGLEPEPTKSAARVSTAHRALRFQPSATVSTVEIEMRADVHLAGIGTDPARAHDATRSSERRRPESLVRAAYAGSIAECAETFGVSEEAMHWRLYNLGLVEERPV